MPPKQNKQSEFEKSIDRLEQNLISKIDNLSGFAEADAKIRLLSSNFKYFDKNNSGFIDFKAFFSALTKLNFIGVQREIEGLFSRYDDDFTGYINYIELSKTLFGYSVGVVLDKASRIALESFRQIVIDRNGPTGLFLVIKKIESASDVNTLSIQREEIENILSSYVDISSGGFTKLLDLFDPVDNRQINAFEFIRILKVSDNDSLL